MASPSPALARRGPAVAHSVKHYSSRSRAAAWQGLGFEILATIPDAFNHPTLGHMGLHIMYRKL